MSFAEIAEFHQAQVTREKALSDFRGGVELACDVWSKVSRLANDAERAARYLSGKDKEEMTELASVYRAMAQRLDGVQKPGEMNVYGAHPTLAKRIR
jgi:hypothetical protein